MFNTYAVPEFEYIRSPDQDTDGIQHHRVIVVGAGPVGMAAAIDLAQNGIDVVILDDNNSVCHGSRAVCYGKRFLDIADRLGFGDRIADRGVNWDVGRVYFAGEEVCQFQNRADNHQYRTGFINLQQYYLEELMVDRISELDYCDLRWRNRVVSIDQSPESAVIGIETPEGRYQLSCDYLIACDGASSTLRHLCGLEFKGEIFRDRFLIVDLLIHSDPFPPERRFWFSPPFHTGQFALLQPQAENLWRVEFDLGWEADPVEEKKPDKIASRMKAFLGDDARFEVEWASVYTFTCRRMDSFREGRVFFAGDAAHQVSPFSARGANSGIEDIDNLIWKVRAVIAGDASAELLKSYTDERGSAADNNIRCSANATAFITPDSDESRAYRNAVLKLARQYSFASSLVNSGRLSHIPVLENSPLSTEDLESFSSTVVPGAPCMDGPILVDGRASYLLARLGNRFHGLLFIDDKADLGKAVLDQLAGLKELKVPINTLIVMPEGLDQLELKGFERVIDLSGQISQALDARSGTYYLLRPDQLVAARMRGVDTQRIAKALNRALGWE